MKQIASVSVAALRGALSARTPPVLLDVRRRPARAASPLGLEAAVWRDPAAVDTWAAQLAPDLAVVCYCVHGHEVSQGVAAALRAKGLDAAYLAGGIGGWRAAGGAVAPLDEVAP